MRRKNQVTGSTALARDQSGKRSGTPDQNLLLAPAWGLVSPAGRPALWQHSVDRVPLSCSVSPATFSQKPSLKAEKKTAVMGPRGDAGWRGQWTTEPAAQPAGATARPLLPLGEVMRVSGDRLARTPQLHEKGGDGEQTWRHAAHQIPRAAHLPMPTPVGWSSRHQPDNLI